MKNFTMNWKTTLAGAVALIVQLGPIFWPKVITPAVANSISVAAVSLGLTAAKDGNVTGAGPTAQAK